MRLKTKLGLALGFLFLVILTFGILSIVSITYLKKASERVLKNNYETLVYGNNMLDAVNDLPADSAAWRLFVVNLNGQEKNITEPGEAEATRALRKSFDLFQTRPGDSAARAGILQNIQLINQLNQQAILRKSELAKNTARNATTWLTIIFSVLTLIAFTLVVNFPAIISGPVRSLSEGISAIAAKDYKRRIHLEQKDEFGDLANAFNSMAEKLDEYEHSNVAQIKFEKSRIETIINRMKDAIIGLDEKKNVLFLNAVAEALLNLKEKEVVGKYVADLALHNDLLRNLLKDAGKKELKIYADNKESYFTKENILVKNEEQVIGEVIVLRNITSFHELDEAKTNFIATISHELKTPLSSIKMGLQLLEKKETGTINEEQKQLIESIKEDSDRLLKITGELLNLSQVETGNIQLSIQQSSPYQILQYATDAVKVQAEQKQIELKIEAEKNLPPVKADTEKTAWVLINFLTNAIRYSSEKGKVLVTIKQEKNTVRFTVKDEGKGIESRYRNKIFDRYFQVPGSSKTGTGLGLAISKEFIEAQGGTIGVETEIGSGSEFYFELLT